MIIIILLPFDKDSGEEAEPIMCIGEMNIHVRVQQSRKWLISSVLGIGKLSSINDKLTNTSYTWWSNNMLKLQHAMRPVGKTFYE